MNRIAPVIGSLLFFCLHFPLLGDTVLSLDDADLKILGAAARDQAFDAAVAGDINGDGFSDLVLGSQNRDASSPGGGGDIGGGGSDDGSNPGRAYLIFGGPSLPGQIDLAALGARGISIVPGTQPGQLGNAVSGAGDFNGDRIDDFMVAAETALSGGVVYVIFGGAPLPSPLDVSALGSRGVMIAGENGSRFGHSISKAGDFNGDSISDIVIGAVSGKSAPAAGDDGDDGHDSRETGTAYVIFGGTDLPQRIDVASLGSRGIVINGAAGGDRLGTCAGNLFDVNGDGLDDVILGAASADPLGRYAAGQAYVVFGNAASPPVINLSSLGAAGVILHGGRSGDNLGSSCACAGDFNLDGAPDLIAGAERASPGGRSHAGQAFIIFGGPGLPPELDLGALGSAGVAINGIGTGDLFGHSVHCIGDFSRDGIEDVAIGAPENNVGGLRRAGQAVVVYGSRSPLPVIELTALGDGGAFLEGVAPGDNAGHRVADAGDINGDQVPDVVICAKLASPSGRQQAGTFYVLHGPPTPTPQDLVCTANLIEASLSWTNSALYDAIRIARNGVTVATLPGSAVSFTDVDPLVGVVTYEVFGALGGAESLPATCTLSLDVLPPFHCVCEVVDGEVVITWVHRHPRPVDGTRIFRNGVFLTEVPGDVRIFTDSNPPAGSLTYAIQDFIGSVSSTLVECTVVVPVPPTDLHCAADGSDVRLSWTNNDAYTSVKVFRDGLLVVTLSAGVLDSFDDHGVPTGMHAYEVQGCIGADCSSRIGCSVKVIGAVAGLAGSSIAGDVSLSWVLPEIGDEVLVFRGGALIASLPGDATSFAETGLAPGSYEYTVRVRIGGDLGKPASIIVEVVGPVVNLRGSSDGNTISQTWENGDTYDFLEIFRDGILIVRLPGSATSLIDTVSGPGDYSYAVVGVRGNGRSAETINMETVPAPPADVQITLADSMLLVSWTNGQPYEAIEVAVNGAVQPRLPGDAASVRYDVEPLGAATVEVRGILSPGALENRSEPARASARAVDAPFDLVCLADGTAVELQWELGGIYDSIRVERDGTGIGVLPGNATSFSDTAPGSGTFAYKVLGVINGLDTFPAACTVVIAGAPADLACVTDGRTASLSWSAAEAHHAVVIERNGERIATLPAGAIAFTDPAPVPGVSTYGVRLAVSGSIGLAATCRIEILMAPADLACAALGSDVDLSWTNNGAYDAIKIFRNGLEVSPPGGLPGASTSFTDMLVSPGRYCYEVQGFTASGAISPPSAPCCVEVILRPIRLICTAFNAEVTLDWVNPRAYDAIEVLRDGVRIALLPGTDTTFTDPQSPLSPGGYLYEVRGMAGGSISESAGCQVQVPVEVSSVACHQAGDSILLEWTLAGIFDAILVHRNGELISTLPGSATRFLDPGLTVDVYTYEIRTGIGGGFSIPVACAVRMINAPRNLNCAQVESSVNLSWTNPEEYDSITIKRNGQVITTPPLAGNAVSFTDESLSPGVYLYEVSGTRGADSSAAAACTVIIIPPIFNLACSINMSRAHLSWTNGGAYDSIELFRKTPSQGAPTLHRTLAGSAVSFTDEPLTEPGEYLYLLAGISAGNRSASARCTAVRLLPPQALACQAENETINFGDVRLTWGNGEAYDSVVIIRNGALLTQLAGDAAVHVDRGLAAGRYEYDVVGTRGASSSDPARCSVTVLLPPPPISNFNCRIDGNTAFLNWTPPTATFDQTRIFRRAPGQMVSSLLATLENTPGEYQDMTATTPGSYRYEIAGVRGGLESARAICDVRKPAPPADIACLPARLTAQGGDVQLSWTNSDPYSSIEISRDGAQIAVLPGGAISFTDPARPQGTYSYTLIGVLDGSRSSASAACTVDVPMAVPPLRNFRCSIIDGKATLTWENAAIYDQIIIERKGPGDNAFILVTMVAGSQTGFMDAVGQPGEYSWRVSAKIGELVSDSAVCSATRPLPPTLEPGENECFTLRNGIEGTDVLLAWTNQGTYDSLIIVRTRLEGSTAIDVRSVSIRGDQTSFLDASVLDGDYSYVVMGVFGGGSASSAPCEISISRPRFIRSEVNSDGKKDVADAIFCFNFIFKGGPAPLCMDAADSNDDGALDIGDGIYILNWQFRGGAAPPSPFPACGPDASEDDGLDCAEFPVNLCR